MQKNECEQNKKMKKYKPLAKLTWKTIVKYIIGSIFSQFSIIEVFLPKTMSSVINNY